MSRLSSKEEAELGARAHSGDQIARNQLVMLNIALARVIARRERGMSASDYDEREAIAFLALIEAAMQFDPERYPGVRFSNFAWRRIFGACRDYSIGIRKSKMMPLMHDCPMPEQNLHEEDREDLMSAIDHLPELERQVIAARYPLNGRKRATLQSLAGKIHKTTIMRRERSGLAHLAERLA